MRKFLLTALAVTTLIGGTALLPAPANANTSPIPYPIGGSISLDVDDVQYGAGGDCVDTEVTVTIDVPDDYSYAEFEYTSTYDGPTTWADEVYGYEDFSGTYDHTFVVCPSFDSPGNYTGYLDVTFYDWDYNEVYAHTSDAFTVRAYHAPTYSSSLSTSKVRSGTHGWNIRSVAKYNGHAWANHRVNLQRKSNGSWHNVKAVWTNGNGVANLTTTPVAGPAKAYRAVSIGNAHVSQKISPTYWLKRR
jgi:hypothetical protein